MSDAGTADHPNESKGWRKLTHAAARAEQRLDTMSMTVAERLAAMAELNRRMYRMQGVEIDDREPGFNAGFVTRRRR
jgi:hypothetical protein